MRKYFNISGTCYPDKHYMVDLTGRLNEIRRLIDRGDYFTINRARQYGKTTILRALGQYLQQDYIVIFLSFQHLSSAKFRDEQTFATAFAETFLRAVRNKRKKVHGLAEHSLNALEELVRNGTDLVELFFCLSELCEMASLPVVLMIDEVDSASNNQVFVDFLAQLRAAYLDRDETPTFQSVILAGVYDVKNLKQKIRPQEVHRYNSPWNIAARFPIDMSFSPQDIAGMLEDYASERHVCINTREVAGLIYDYTSGYPFLVSDLCKILDEQIRKEDCGGTVWSAEGVLEAVRLILKESNTLFDDMCRKITDYPKLRAMLHALLFDGKSFPYNPDHPAIEIGTMFGFVKEDNGFVAVSNRIFETRLYNLFLSEELMDNATYQAALLERSQFIRDGYLDMDRVLEKFVEHFTDVYSGSGTTFIEENARRLFLMYLKPIINGVGNYYIEARTRDMRRTDVIVDYRGRQYIIELKIWHGEAYNNRGEDQLAQYLEDYHAKKRYLITFSFNKNKTPEVKTVICGDKTIVEAVV